MSRAGRKSEEGSFTLLASLVYRTQGQHLLLIWKRNESKVSSEEQNTDNRHGNKMKSVPLSEEIRRGDLDGSVCSSQSQN